MSKLQVIDKDRETRIPFLRGMLTKSLQRSGLEFVDAYKLATEIREDFDDVESITIEELRERIIEALAEDFPDKVLQRYQKKIVYTDSIAIVQSDGQVESFSRGVFIKRLQSCALPMDICSSITHEIHTRLISQQHREVTKKQLVALTYQTIRRQADQKMADRYLVWYDFHRSSIPLVIMIGGIPGSGKSTMATEIANRLSIIRTQSTDMLREVMRALIPRRVAPSLHDSSFNAGKALHSQDFYKTNKEEATVRGFEMQSDMVSVACDSVLRRAINEQVSVILEGVHIRAGLYEKMNRSEDAVIVPVMLAVLEKSRLKRNFRGRSEQVEKRAAKRYLKNLDLIWQLQTAILSEADSADIEIIDNVDLDETINEICRVVTETLAVHYKGKIKELRQKFGQYETNS